MLFGLQDVSRDIQIFAPIELQFSPERLVVALLRLGDEPLLLEGVGQVAVRVGEVGLELDGATVGLDGEVNEPERFELGQKLLPLMQGQTNPHPCS